MASSADSPEDLASSCLTICIHVFLFQRIGVSRADDKSNSAGAGLHRYPVNRTSRVKLTEGQANA
jgi:hypothetical protein